MSESNVSRLPAPPALAELSWRPLTAADADALHHLSVACYRADGLQSPQPVAEIAQIFDFLGEKLATDSLAAFTAQDELVAMALVFLPPAGDEQKVNLNGQVHVAYRGRGLGTFLLDWMEVRTRQLLVDVPTDLPHVLQTAVRDHQQDRIELLEAHGFYAARYFYRMERNLHEPITSRPLPPDLTLTTWTEALDEATRLAFNDSFRDHYGFMPMNAELWQRFFTGKDTFRADLSTLAVQGKQVIGFCLSAVDAFRNEQQGRLEGVMDEIGVIRGWRQRGIASALIMAAMHRFRAAGLDYAMLSVDTESPTGALRLYEKLGFQTVRRGVNYAKRVN